MSTMATGTLSRTVSTASNVSKTTQTVSHQDPGGILLGWVNETIPGRPTAREAIFAWLMALPSTENPSDAAQQVLDDYGLKSESNTDTQMAELSDLLSEIRQFSGASLSRGRRRTSRREARILN